DVCSSDLSEANFRPPTRKAGNPAWEYSSTPSRLSAILRKSAAVIDGLCRLRSISPSSDAICLLLVFHSHVNVGFFHGAALPDPARLLQGTGKFMRHVKLAPGTATNAAA